MKILGGSQLVFYGIKGQEFEKQLDDCLSQLKELMDLRQIYPGSFIRHNLYLNVDNEEKYNKLKPRFEQMIRRQFPLPMVVSIIAQAPGQGDLALESTYVQGGVWNCLYREDKHGACQLIKDKQYEMVIGAVQVQHFPDMESLAKTAYQQIEILLDKCEMRLGNLIKQWTYIERMHDNEQLNSRYQAFCNVRTDFYNDEFTDGGFPAATEVGMKTGGIIIEFMAMKNRNDYSSKVENPAQKQPHEYSAEALHTKNNIEEQLLTTPKLERARTLTMNNKTMLFVSGVSAIIGERVTAEGNAKEQAVVILENLKQLTAKNNLVEWGLKAPFNLQFTLCKVFVKSLASVDIVYEIIKPIFEHVPLLIVEADLAREEILVELETELLV